MLEAGTAAEGVREDPPSSCVEKELAYTGSACISLKLPEYLEIPWDHCMAPAPPRLDQIGESEIERLSREQRERSAGPIVNVCIFHTSLVESLLLVFITSIFISIHCRLCSGSHRKNPGSLLWGGKPTSATHWVDSRQGEINSFFCGDWESPSVPVTFH